MTVTTEARTPAHQWDIEKPQSPRYRGVQGKVVHWVEHTFEEGLLYIHVRFTDKTARPDLNRYGRKLERIMNALLSL